MQPQETNPASKQDPAENQPSKEPPKPMTADEKKGCGCIVLIVLSLCFLLNKCACSNSSKTKNSSVTSSTASGVFQQQFQHIFDGRLVTIGNFSEVEMMMLVKAIYKGHISDEDATRCLIYPAKCIVAQSCGLQQMVGQYLIFEGFADGRERYAIAVRRDASFESKHRGLRENFSDMRGADLTDMMPDEALAYEGREEFTTSGGFVRLVPAFRIVRPQP